MCSCSPLASPGLPAYQREGYRRGAVGAAVVEAGQWLADGSGVDVPAAYSGNFDLSADKTSAANASTRTHPVARKALKQEHGHAYPRNPAAVAGVTQFTESRCITGGIGDWYDPS